MFDKNRRLARELVTITRMTEMYCAAHHGDADTALCADCADFVDYIAQRLEKCPYGSGKPTCANCPIHCYKPARREQGNAIMRYAGPKMLLRHPWLTLAHYLDGLVKVVHPRELTREQRSQMRDS